MMNKKVLTLDDEPIASIYYTMKECMEKPLNFDPFGHARFAHLFVLYD